MAGMFTTKGRYALRVMADLAQHEGWVSLGDVAERQNLSRKYLEQVISSLVKVGYVQSQRGKGGGYKLSRAPKDYSIGEILRAVEGPLAPVECLDCSNDEICPIRETCPTLPMWRELGAMTSRFLNSKTLEELVPSPDEISLSVSKVLPYEEISAKINEIVG
ncbi:MAG: RrF2 family transcriptional regulator [Atopobiaceae bacterium]|nr:RrF2 family transcriptional regulator [Atopobiaceae bacterium]